jgi:hypothetical protein
MMLTPKVLAMLALASISAVLAAPIAGDGLVEREAADYGKYGNYGKYGDAVGIKSMERLLTYRPGSYGAYPPPPTGYGKYGSYGAYARAVEDEAA